MREDLDAFVRRFDAEIDLDDSIVAQNEDKLFLLNDKIKIAASLGFIYAGVYLGRSTKEGFVPGFGLLNMLIETKANKICIDKKTEWLFICGRDIFKRGVIKSFGTNKKGAFALVVNSYGECLGFGEILCDPTRVADGVVLKNLLDIGDFLRRER